MATNTYKSLGQLLPSANTLTTAYTVPAVTKTIVSSVVVCNESASPGTFRLSHAISGAADALAQYLAYDFAVPANQAFIFTIGITMAQTDLLRVMSSNGAMAFNIYGQEVA